jgi:type I restriction enzyme S subunit
MIFSEFVEINPKVKLTKNNAYSFIGMELLQPGFRYVTSKEAKSFNGGGTKFKSGDVLFARITPCLENGKIAQFKGTSGDVGFGSTEFFVFRGKDGTSDSAYVYYLSISSILREPAEKSMSGASGRQRADIASIKDLNVPSPSLGIQKKIASILTAYDDLFDREQPEAD